MVTWENYEEYLLLHVDGELNDAEQRALLGFIALHPEVEDELRVYQSTVLTPDTTAVYEQKAALLKAIPGGKAIALRQWWAYGAAAGVILIISLWAFRWTSSDQTVANRRNEVATTDAYKNKQTPSGKVQPSPTISSHLPLSPTSFDHQEKGTSVARNSIHSNNNPVAKEVAQEKIEIRTIKPITNKIAVEMTPAPVELVPVPDSKVLTEPSAVQDRSSSNLLAWLPEEKKEGLELLKENVDQKVGKANQIRENIKDTQLAFKLGNKELVVINF